MGPQNLLTEVKEEKIDLHEISLTEILDEWLKSTPISDLGTMLSLLDVITLLMQMKLSLFLQVPAQEIEEDEPIDTDVDYEWVRNLRAKLKVKEEIARSLFERPRIEQKKSLDFDESTRTALYSMFREIIKRYQKIERLDIKKDSVNIKSKMDEILTLLKKNNKIGFSELARGKPSIIEAITIFVAILELTRQRKISLKQYKPFGEIWIKRQ